MYSDRGYYSATPRDAAFSRSQRRFGDKLTLCLAIRLPSLFDWFSCPAQPVYLYSLLSTVTLQCLDCTSTSSRLLQASSGRYRLQVSLWPPATSQAFTATRYQV
ncbi:hypothetical protein E2C01_035554 [Portunus trituberculatus]|uniref:Uncharacterized protein n=1 Tax=Portunus trituberculatus TaxID=210409 RepID=A0A5B7FA32_PORTR|nr:hypothetical protein [Portunus trituberculatus]